MSHPFLPFPFICPHDYIESLHTFIQTHKWLSDFYAIHFITTDYWNTGPIPPEWKILEWENDDTLCRVASEGFVKDEWPETLKQFVLDASRLGMKRNASNFEDVEYISPRIAVGMNTKKVKETGPLASIIRTLSHTQHISHILDLGAGQGYLSSVLAYQYSLNVLAIDGSSSQIAGGRRRAENIQKRLGDGQGRLAFLERSVQEEEDLESFMEVGTNSFGEGRWGICGLHTCGDLASTTIRGFLTSRASVLVNVGCCYNKLTEKGFPMSQHYKSRNWTLSANLLMVACQAPSRWTATSTTKMSFNNLYYRALLQDILVSNSYPTTIPIGSLPQSAFTDFETYIRTAFNRLKLPMPLMPLQIYLAKHQNARRQIAALWTLRALIADVVETFILMDRWSFGRELDGVKVLLEPVVDPVVSPRNMAIVFVNERKSDSE
ncbi:hypothetical protein SpCBS45565_g05372 [Spizellomyces sp. 'palustris']|nr:hypothetical protein SpCBS45565_g05372 [Spizellomyces sp. 'palustris']